MSDKKMITVRIRDMDTILYEGEAERISSFNEVGPFDVYPAHANFISIIKKQLTLFQNKQKIKEVPFEQAIMKVKQDIAHIFLGIEAFAMDEATPSQFTPAKK